MRLQLNTHRLLLQHNQTALPVGRSSLTACELSLSITSRGPVVDESSTLFGASRRSSFAVVGTASATIGTAVSARASTELQCTDSSAWSSAYLKPNFLTQTASSDHGTSSTMAATACVARHPLTEGVTFVKSRRSMAGESQRSATLSTEVLPNATACASLSAAVTSRHGSVFDAATAVSICIPAAMNSSARSLDSFGHFAFTSPSCSPTSNTAIVLDANLSPIVPVLQTKSAGDEREREARRNDDRSGDISRTIHGVQQMQPLSNYPHDSQPLGAPSLLPYPPFRYPIISVDYSVRPTASSSPLCDDSPAIGFTPLATSHSHRLSAASRLGTPVWACSATGAWVSMPPPPMSPRIVDAPFYPASAVAALSVGGAHDSQGSSPWTRCG